MLQNTEPVLATDTFKDILLKQGIKLSNESLSALLGPAIRTDWLSPERIRIKDTSFIIKFLTHKHILAAAYKYGGQVQTVSLNADLNRADTASMDIAFSGTNLQEQPKEADVMPLYKINGVQPNLIATPSVNMFFLTTQDDKNGFRRGLENRQIDSAVNWIQAQGLEITSQNPTSVFALGNKIRIPTMAFIIR